MVNGGIGPIDSSDSDADDKLDAIPPGFTIPSHAGYVEQPQNCVPDRLPLLAVRNTIALLQRGHEGVSIIWGSSDSDDVGTNCRSGASLLSVWRLASEALGASPWMFSRCQFSPFWVRMGFEHTGQVIDGIGCIPVNENGGLN